MTPKCPDCKRGQDDCICASPASAPVTAPVYRIADRGFRWDAENRQHIPQLLIEFTPVPENEPNASNGWKDRDSLAVMLAAAPTPPSKETLEAAGHRLALELECLLLDCKDNVVVSRWMDTACEALDAWRNLFPYNGPRLGD